MGGCGLRRADARDGPLDLGCASCGGPSVPAHRRAPRPRRTDRRGTPLSGWCRARRRRDARSARGPPRTRGSGRRTDEPARCALSRIQIRPRGVGPRHRGDGRPHTRGVRGLGRRTADKSIRRCVQLGGSRAPDKTRWWEDVHDRRPCDSCGGFRRAVGLDGGREPAQRRRRRARRLRHNSPWRKGRRPCRRRSIKAGAVAQRRHVEASRARDQRRKCSLAPQR